MYRHPLSTRPVPAHGGYPFWSGGLSNLDRVKTDRVDIDLTHNFLSPGKLCNDGQFRQIVTVEDPVHGGCNLFDIDQLRLEYSPPEYQNLLMCEFIDDLASVFPLADLQAFSRFVQDYLVFGTAYVEKRTNRLGGVLWLDPALAKFTWRGTDLDTYWFVQYGLTSQPYEFIKGSIFHLMKPDLNQEVYGLPEYLSAIPSKLLNESATLFRRKYYINGSHAGFIMYMTDPAQS